MGQILILLVGCIGAHYCFYTPSPITSKQMLLMDFPQAKIETHPPKNDQLLPLIENWDHLVGSDFKEKFPNIENYFPFLFTI